jgi:hypothetical protein
VEYRPDEAEVIALRSAAVGGERFDQLLFNSKVAAELGLHDEYTGDDGSKHRLPNRVRANSRALLDLQGLLSDPTLRGILQRFKAYENGEKLEKFERLLYEGFAYHFYEAIEESKIRLSSESETSISFHRPGLDVDIPITRVEFDALIERDIGLLQDTIVAALGDAGVNSSSIERVVQTGGSSAIPLFTDMVRSVFPRSDLQQRPPFTTVVEGLGYYAQGIWQ